MSTPLDTFEILVDHEAATDGPTLRLAPNATLDDALAAVAGIFAHETRLEAIRLAVGGRSIGSTTRSYLRLLFGLGAPGAGFTTTRGIGDSDGATLPGSSTRFVVLRYLCPTDAAHPAEFRVVHDDDSPPRCVACDAAMGLAT
ncbi:hypothetical protein [Frankia sp. AvcI1]|uniref:hypothetical protein n=1 Tax=Frankia sp. AvcI1 TaxID=573496 RepID=UPI0021196B3D|nr:hypothetical protein [Frankia sp. AvcI1]